MPTQRKDVGISNYSYVNSPIIHKKLELAKPVTAAVLHSTLKTTPSTIGSTARFTYVPQHIVRTIDDIKLQNTDTNLFQSNNSSEKNLQPWNQNQKIYSKLIKSLPDFAPKVLLTLVQPQQRQFLTSSASLTVPRQDSPFLYNTITKFSNKLETAPKSLISCLRNRKLQSGSNITDSEDSEYNNFPYPQHVTICNKKSIALTAILICFIAFVCFYIVLAIYAIFT